MRRFLLLAMVAAALAMTAACADPGPERTLTADEALGEVRDALRVAEQVVGAPVTSDLPGGPLRTDCSDPVDGGPLGRVYWAAYYGTSRPETRPRNEVLPSLDELTVRMQQSGWTVSRDRRTIPDAPEVIFARPSAVELSVSFTGDSVLGYDVTATTACVWPNGVRP